ncbi:MAG: DNA-binding protein [Phycisphaerae bacterium]|nr:DNA-binding protein [Phycisphaerae bacterium]
MNLTDWATNGWVIPHRSSSQEIADLLAIADRDMSDCQSEGLSPDWRFSIAYNAVLQSATAALAAAGYRAGRDSHHYRILQSLGLTVGLSATTVRQLDAFRKKRNMTEYERAGGVSDVEVAEIVEAAQTVRQRVEEWIRQEHPELM